jgi:bacteriorhodopsin
MENYIFSFYLTYILLLTTATITFIEAIRTKIPAVQHIMNLETCISLIGGYFYSVFNEKLRKYQDHANMNIDWNEITQLRYIDWAITTPFMLLVLSLVLSFNSKTKIRFHWFALSVVFNYMMLLIGYLGETEKLERIISNILGFLAFFVTFGIIFMQYVLPRYTRDNYILFGLYVFVWGMYGIAYNFDEINKNILMNYLDLISKCLIGIGLWIYYTKIIKFA